MVYRICSHINQNVQSFINSIIDSLFALDNYLKLFYSIINFFFKLSQNVFKVKYTNYHYQKANVRIVLFEIIQN